ncbi:Ig-like domain-containing protein [Paenarthrobacter sp. NPDC089675]|uniref:Ig-like domain-containing protein n=1 Tax=Paenarthrobacter sp. NPDC089675 TaxID=3364376 RepID=UPI00381BF2CA
MNNQPYLKAASAAAALLAALFLTVGLVWSAASAHAADIVDAKISLSTESVVTNQWDQVNLSCQWSVPDHSQPGDTFELQLPPQLRWFGSTSFDLNSPGGDTVAKAVANDSGLVVFTLTEFVKDHPLDIGGTCAFTTQYSKVPGDDTGSQLDFVVGSSVVRVPLDIKPCTSDCAPVPTSAGKSMWWADADQTRLESIIYMPPMQSDKNDVVVTDTPADGMEIDCDEVTPRVGRTVNATGNLTDPLENDKYPAAIDCTPHKVTATWAALPKDERVELFVVAQVTDSSLDVYTNTGTVTIAGVESAVDAETKRTTASGTGDGTAAPSETPSPSPSTTPASPTATPSPSPSTTPASPTATPTPSPSTTPASPTATPTPSPSATTATPTPTGSPSTPAPSKPAVTAPAPTSSAPVTPPSRAATTPAAATTTDELASTGASGPLFIFVGVGFLAVGSLLAFAATRFASRRRSH